MWACRVVLLEYFFLFWQTWHGQHIKRLASSDDLSPAHTSSALVTEELAPSFATTSGDDIFIFVCVLHIFQRLESPWFQFADSLTRRRILSAYCSGGLCTCTNWLLCSMVSQKTWLQMVCLIWSS